MTEPNKNLRPYYKPQEFRSPGSGDDRNSAVYVTYNNGSQYPGTSKIRDMTRKVESSEFDYVLDVDVNASESIREIGSSMLRIYSKVLVSQPFEISRTLLQVGDWSKDNKSSGIHGSMNHKDGDESEEEGDYFSYSEEASKALVRRRKRPYSLPEDEENPLNDSSLSSFKTQWKKKGYPSTLDAKSIKILEIMSSLNMKDGIKGLWRGTHTSFFLDALKITVEAWISGFLSAVFGISDPYFVEILHSPNPLISLTVSTIATVSTAVLLSPLDIIRTKFFVTTFETRPRSLRRSLMKFNSFNSPSQVIIPTILYSSLPTIINKGTPYFLSTRLGIDRVKNPLPYNIFSLGSSIFELIIKMPLETLLKRSQVAWLNLAPHELIIAPAPYSGVLGSFWHVLIGTESLESYYMGWRTAVLGAMGDWGLDALKNDDKIKERF